MRRAVEVWLPGQPVAQGRPLFARVGRHVRAIDPPKSRAWKAMARQLIGVAMAGRPPLEGPVVAEIEAVFSCPKADQRKRTSCPRRPHAVRPDASNVAKAVEDAASGLVWLDDAQVARLLVTKVIGAQGEAPGVWLRAEPLEGKP